MTQSLERAFGELSRLLESQQDALARRLLDELAAEKKWDDLFAESEGLLATLADEALEVHKSGKAKPLDFSAL